MKKKERQLAILELMRHKSEVHTSLVCRTFNIVEMTVRRDFKEMQQRGEIIRTHGGAIAIERKIADAEIPLIKRLKKNLKAKQFIAKLASDFLEPNDKVFIASGSTIDVFSQSLRPTMPLTIITSALNVAVNLSHNKRYKVFVLGGELRSNALSLTGTFAESSFQNFKIKKSFISINAIDDEGNLYTSSIVESSLLKILFDYVEDIYILADSSKFGIKDLVAIEHHMHYTLITDKFITDSTFKKYQALGIQVINSN